MKLGRFVWRSLALGVGWCVLVLWLSRIFWPDVPASAVGSGFVAAWFISTVGWVVVGRGMARTAQQFAGFFVAGVLIKLVLLAAVVLVVNGFRLAPTRIFVAGLAGGFMLVYFSQLVLIVREALDRLQKDPKSSV